MIQNPIVTSRRRTRAESSVTRLTKFPAGENIDGFFLVTLLGMPGRNSLNFEFQQKLAPPSLRGARLSEASDVAISFDAAGSP